MPRRAPLRLCRRRSVFCRFYSSNDASRRFGCLIGAHEGRVDHEGGHSCVHEFRDGVDCVEAHGVVDMASAEYIGHDREAVSFSVLHCVCSTPAIALGTFLIAGSFAHEHTMLAYHELLISAYDNSQLNRGPVAELIDLLHR